MNVIIVDDEAAVRNSITTLLREKFPEINVLASVGSVNSGYEAVVKHRPDLLFLDIELPDGLGFDLLKKIGKASFRVIFITGHQEYALAAIKVSALDYILKPVDTDELQKAIEKARETINSDDEQLKLQALTENLQTRRVLKRIILRTADSLQLVSLTEIIRAEADSNYTHFHLAGGKHVIVSRTIKEFDGLLSGSGIIRVHQSHLVNIHFIDKIMKHDGGYILLKNGTKVPISPNLKKSVLQAMNDHLYV